MVSDPATDQFERELGREVAPALPRAGDDRPADDEPEIPQQEAYSDEQEPNQWIRSSRDRSGLAVRPIARFDG